MKRLRLEKWGSQFLKPRPGTRRICPFAAGAQDHPRSQFRPQNYSRQQRRCQSTQAAEPPSPPPSLVRPPREQLPSPPVDQAKASAKLAALHARLSLPSRFPVQTLARCLVDATADPNPNFNNVSLAQLGSDLLGYYTGEHIICHYPRLPMPVLQAALYAYVGPKALAAMCAEWGIETVAEPGGEVDPGLLQYKAFTPGTPLEELHAMEKYKWRRGYAHGTVQGSQFGDDIRPGNLERLQGGQSKTTKEDASAQFIRALTGAMYLHGGLARTTRFIQSHILTRHLEIANLFQFKTPTVDLSKLCAREGFEQPVARLISETGRHSRSPVFLVGVFSGKDKLGEGVGASLNEGRWRAAVNALRGWYLWSPMDITLPSQAEALKKEGKNYIPNHVDCGEVVV